MKSHGFPEADELKTRVEDAESLLNEFKEEVVEALQPHINSIRTDLESVLSQRLDSIKKDLGTSSKELHEKFKAEITLWLRSLPNAIKGNLESQIEPFRIESKNNSEEIHKISKEIINRAARDESLIKATLAWLKKCMFITLLLSLAALFVSFLLHYVK